MRSLREYIKLIVEDARDQIGLAAIKSILVDQNVDTIPRGGDFGGFLGAGEYNVAYECTWKGKHSVIKITNTAREVLVAERVKLLNEDLPTKLSKHLPVIFKTDKTRIDGQYYGIVIMEYLFPLPKSLRAMFFDEKSNNEAWDAAVVAQVKFYMKDHDALKNAIRNIVNEEANDNPSLKDARVAIVNGLLSLTERYLQEIAHYDFIDVDKLGHGHSAFLNPIRTLATELHVKDFNFKRIKDKICGLFYDEKKSFPLFSRDLGTNRERTFADKRVQSLFNAMQKLDKLGIAHWGDLHYNNVMMRRDGTLVASDVGLFSFPTEYVSMNKNTKKS